MNCNKKYLTNDRPCVIFGPSEKIPAIDKQGNGRIKMKYFGARSVSSVISVILAVMWPLVLAMSICGAAFFGAMVFSDKVDSFIMAQAAKDHNPTAKELKDIKDWEEFRHMPAPLKALFFPYGAAVVIVLMMAIRRSKLLFDNFKKNIIFSRENVELMKRANKAILVFSIMTFNFSGIFTCIMLYMLAEIFKNGADLQEEHDLTV